MSNKDYTQYSEKNENKEIVDETITNTGETSEDLKGDSMIAPDFDAKDEIENPEAQNNETEPCDPEVETDKPSTDPEDEIKPVIAVEGTVIGCSRLNVRREPSKDSQAIYILDKGSKVSVVKEESTEDFYKIHTMDIEGYCVKEFIDVK